MVLQDSTGKKEYEIYQGPTGGRGGQTSEGEEEEKVMVFAVDVMWGMAGASRVKGVTDT